MATYVTTSHATRFKKVVNTIIRNGGVLDDYAISVFADCDINLVRLWLLVKSIKEQFSRSFCDDGMFESYIGMDEIIGEGYAWNDHGTYKLVHANNSVVQTSTTANSRSDISLSTND